MPDNLLKIAPEYMGVLLAMSIGFIRVIYDKNETKPVRVIMESLICGGLSVTATAAIQAMNMDLNWAIFAGGVIGFFGTVTVRALAMKLLEKRLQKP